MDGGTVIILSYVIQIPLVIYAAFYIPMRGELGEFYERNRKGIIVFGLLPCAYGSVIFQLIFLAIYMVKVKTLEARSTKAQSRFNRSLGGQPVNSSSDNPFGGSNAPAPPPQPASGNPFVEGGSMPTTPPPSPDDPTSGGTGGSSTKPPGDNPFL